MKRIAACALLAIIALSADGSPKLRPTLRVHVEANANDTDVFSSRLLSPTTRKEIVMEKIPRLSEQDVLAFYPYQAPDGSFGALFRLTEHGKLVLDTLSVERRGAFVYIFVNGRPVAEQQIDRRVTDGKLFVASGLSQSDLALMGKEWRVIGRPKKK